MKRSLLSTNCAVCLKKLYFWRLKDKWNIFAGPPSGLLLKSQQLRPNLGARALLYIDSQLWPRVVKGSANLKFMATRGNLYWLRTTSPSLDYDDPMMMMMMMMAYKQIPTRHIPTSKFPPTIFPPANFHPPYSHQFICSWGGLWLKSLSRFRFLWMNEWIYRCNFSPRNQLMSLGKSRG